MPQAVGFILFGSAAGISVAGVALTTATGALTGIGLAVNIGASLLLTTALQSALGRGGQVSTPPPEDLLQNFKSSVAPRQIHMGRAKVGGAMMFPPRSSRGKIYILLAQMHGEIQERTKHFLDGREVSLWKESAWPYLTPAGPEGGYVGSKQYQYNGRSMVQILFRMGTPTQTANQELVSAFPDWTEDHTLSGIATALVIADSPSAQKFNGMFPNRSPEYTCEGSWHKVEDPRTGLVQHSENPIVHLRDFMLSSDGMALTSSDLNGSFIEAMNECDEVLATGVRYRIGGTYRLIDQPREVIRQILNTCDGEVYRDAEGKFGVRVGVGIQPTVSLSKDHLHTVLDWTNGNSILQGYTSLKPKYTDQLLGFSSSTIDPWRDESLVARYRQETYGADFGLLLVPDHTQARFLSKIRTKKDNPIFKGTLRYDLHALSAIGQEYINIDLDFDEFGVDYTGPARVDSISLAGGSIDRPDSLTHVDITVSVLAKDTYSRTLAEAGTPPTASVSDSSAGFPIVSNFAAGPSGVQTAQNTYTAGISIVWDAPTQSTLSALIEVAPAGTQQWQATATDPEAVSAQITGLVDGASYDVRHAWISPAATIGPYTTLTNITASATTGTPNPPQILSVTDSGGGTASVSFTASSSPAIWKTEVLRDGVVIYSQVTASGAVLTFTDSPTAGTYAYTARTLDVSGNPSALLATVPATITIT